jgi:predicted methyltransferase
MAVVTVESCVTVATVLEIVTVEGAVVVHVCLGTGYFDEQYVEAGAHPAMAAAKLEAEPEHFNGAGHVADARQMVV